MALRENGQVRQAGLPCRREDLESAGTGRMGSAFYRWRFAPARLPAVLGHDWSQLGRRVFVDPEQEEVTLMAPSAVHENMSWLVGHLAWGAATTLSIPCDGLRATTWSPPGQRRVEADESFYLGESALRYRKLEDDSEWNSFAGINPPQLVVEVERTHGDTGKPVVYRTLGATEMWRIDTHRWPALIVEILDLQRPDGVTAADRSAVLPGLTPTFIARMLGTARRQGAGAIPGLLAAAGIGRPDPQE